MILENNFSILKVSRRYSFNSCPWGGLLISPNNWIAGEIFAAMIPKNFAHAIIRSESLQTAFWFLLEFWRKIGLTCFCIVCFKLHVKSKKPHTNFKTIRGSCHGPDLFNDIYPNIPRHYVQILYDSPLRNFRKVRIFLFFHRDWWWISKLKSLFRVQRLGKEGKKLNNF
jgi:hypothetical protein